MGQRNRVLYRGPDPPPEETLSTEGAYFGPGMPAVSILNVIRKLAAHAMRSFATSFEETCY